MAPEARFASVAPDISVAEKIARVLIAIAVALALAMVATVVTSARLASESTTPEAGIAMPIGRGWAAAAYAERLAATGAAPGRIALWSVVAVRSSPLRPQAFAAAALTTPDPVLIGPLAEHAHALSRLDPALLTFMIRRAAKLGDERGFVTYSDELLRQGKGGARACADLSTAMARPAAIPELAQALAAGPGWRTGFFASAPRSPGAAAGLVTLARLLARGPHPLTRAEANLALQGLFGAHDGRNAEALAQVVSNGADPFAWPLPANDGSPLPSEWQTMGGAAWDDSGGQRVLRYDLSGRGETAVASRRAAIRAGRYRVAITPADGVTALRYQCGNVAQSLGDGAVLEVAQDCTPATIELIGAGRAARLTSARLVPQP